MQNPSEVASFTLPVEFLGGPVKEIQVPGYGQFFIRPMDVGEYVQAKKEIDAANAEDPDYIKILICAYLGRCLAKPNGERLIPVGMESACLQIKEPLAEILLAESMAKNKNTVQAQEDLEKN
jgi:hypothetical protein